jgi:transposase
MDELFAIDAQARELKMTRRERHLLRQQRAQPLLEGLKTAIEAARIGALPQSALAKGCNYTLTLWKRLTRFLEQSQLELSNNLAENAIRPVALGRNYEQSGIMQSWEIEENSQFRCAVLG